MSDSLSIVKEGVASGAQRMRPLLRVAVGIVILGAILCLVDVRDTVRTLGSLNGPVALILGATFILGHLVRAYKWNLLLRARGIHISQCQAIRLIWISRFVGAWTPGALGAVAYRVVALRRFRNTNVVLSTLLIERYATMMILCILALLTMPLTIPHLMRHSPWLVVAIIVMIALVLVALPLLLSSRTARWISRWIPAQWESGPSRGIREFHRTLLQYREHPLVLATFALLTVVEVLIFFMMSYLAARALDMDVSLLFFMCAMPLFHLFLRIPISFQGLGVQEGCFVYTLALHGFTPAEGLAVSVVRRAVEWVVSIVPGGLLLWLTSGARKGRVSMESAVSSEQMADVA